MKKESLEHLSSLMDGELSREAGLFITRRLSSDEEMCGTWERYHLIRDCIRQPGSKQVVTGLSARLTESMVTPQAGKQAHASALRWLKPVSGLAIAASVALMAIVVSVPQAPVRQNPDGLESTAAAQSFVSPNTAQLTPVSQAASYSAGQQAGPSRLNAYLLRHNQMARTAGRQGFVSFVPIVATPVEAAAEKPDSETEEQSRRSSSETDINR
jgi:sigma-E factor negative regulatory protein RseA